MKKITTKDMALCALFAAMSAALSPYSIPIPFSPVPITLTHISVFLAGGLLGARGGAVSQIVFVLIGAMGAPVFSGFQGGLGVLAGPTGGFIIGYVICAFMVGLIAERFGKGMKILPLAMTAGALCVYAPGILWFMFVTNAGLLTAITACVIPFLPGDAVKIIIGSALVNKLAPVLKGRFKSDKTNTSV